MHLISRQIVLLDTIGKLLLAGCTVGVHDFCVIIIKIIVIIMIVIICSGNGTLYR